MSRRCGTPKESILVCVDNGGQFRSKVWQTYLDDPEEKQFDHQWTAYRNSKEIYQKTYEDPLKHCGRSASGSGPTNKFKPHQGLRDRAPEEIYLEGMEALKLKNGQSANQNHGASDSKL